MSIPIAFHNGDTIDALARARYVVLQRANSLLTTDEAPAPAEASDTDRINGISGLLMTSLEELKVAEEELRTQNVALVTQRTAQEERTHYYRQLFLHAPVAVLVTDIFATIHEANIAAGRLLHRDPDYLKRKPIVALIAPDDREEFRRRLRRFLEADGAKQLSVRVARKGDVPLEVHATVSRVPDVGPTKSGMLFWMIGSEKWSEAAKEG